MTFKEHMTKPKIISLILIFCLVIFCFIVARIGMQRIIEPETPLSSVNIEAMFYVEMPDNGQIICIGDGLINSSDEKSGEIAVERSVVTAPDNSAFVGNSYHVVWNNIRHGDNGIEVYGKAESGPKPVREDVVSVRDFGAVGDGVTDDSAAINNALKAAVSNTLYIPSGVYILAKPIYIPSNVTIAGDGANTVLMAVPSYGVSKDLIKTRNSHNISVKNITISGNILYNTREMGHSPVDGIHMFDIWTSSDISFESCYFIDNVYAGIRVVGECSNIKVNNCKFTNIDCGVITLGKGNVSNLTVTNSLFDGHEWSEPISLFGTGTYSNITITDNTIKNKLYGTSIALVRGPIIDFIVANNTVYNCATGIVIEKGSNGIIENNTIDLCATNGGGGITIRNSNGVIVRNNTVSNTSHQGILLKNSENIQVYDNSFTDCGFKAKDYHIVEVQGEVNNCNIENNTITRTNDELSPHLLTTKSKGSLSITNNTLNNGKIVLYNGSSNVNVFDNNATTVDLGSGNTVNN